MRGFVKQVDPSGVVANRAAAPRLAEEVHGVSLRQRGLNRCSPESSASSREQRVRAQEWLTKQSGHQIIQEQQQLNSATNAVPGALIERYDGLDRDLPGDRDIR